MWKVIIETAIVVLCDTPIIFSIIQKREAIEKRLEIIKLFDDYGAEAPQESVWRRALYRFPLETEAEKVRRQAIFLGHRR